MLFEVLFCSLSFLVNYDIHLSRTALTLFLAYNRRFARAAQACDEVLLYSQLLISATNSTITYIIIAFR